MIQHVDLLECSTSVLMMCNKSDNDTKASAYVLQQHEQGEKKKPARANEVKVQTRVQLFRVQCLLHKVCGIE